MNLYLYAFLALELVLISYVDLRTKKISNLWPLFHIILFVALKFAFPEDYPLALVHFIYPLSFIILGFVLFVFHIMGAGDSKYLASLFLVTPTPLHMLLLEKLLTVTIFVGTILIILKFVKSAAKIRAYLLTLHLAGLKSEISSRFSYAPVILVTWILFGVSLWH